MMPRSLGWLCCCLWCSGGLLNSARKHECLAMKGEKPYDRHRHDCTRTGSLSRLRAGEAGEILIVVWGTKPEAFGSSILGRKCGYE